VFFISVERSSLLLLLLRGEMIREAFTSQWRLNKTQEPRYVTPKGSHTEHEGASGTEKGSSQ